MRKKKNQWAALLCIGIFFFTACGKRTDVSAGDEFIYCLNESETGLVKVEFEASERNNRRAGSCGIEGIGKTVGGY